MASILEVFWVFLRLGLTSFGGPIAHLGYFRQEFVERRAWVSESQFVQLLALCQFLPGPASSQLGFSIGLLRAGWSGAFAAFVAFTLPSAFLLFVFATLMPLATSSWFQAALHGLKLLALSVVAHGVIGMTRQLCPDTARRGLALASALFVICFQPAWAQWVVVLGGGIFGYFCCHRVSSLKEMQIQLPYRAKMGGFLMILFVLLLLGLPLLAQQSGGSWQILDLFYRAGSLVFGGGHVVLPLLETSLVTPGWISSTKFMAGYGAAQAIPGPMFSLASFLGASMPAPYGGISGAVLATLGIFLPGFLLLAACLPLWHFLSHRNSAARVIAGINAAVVGLLLAALYHPVWTTAIHGIPDILIALVGLLMLSKYKKSPLWVLLWSLASSIGLCLT